MPERIGSWVWASWGARWRKPGKAFRRRRVRRPGVPPHRAHRCHDCAKRGGVAASCPGCLPFAAFGGGRRGGRARQRRSRGFDDQGFPPHRSQHEPAVPLTPHRRTPGGEGRRVRRCASERGRGRREVGITGHHGRRHTRHVQTLPAVPAEDREDRRPRRRCWRRGRREACEQHDRGHGILPSSPKASPWPATMASKRRLCTRQCVRAGQAPRCLT